MVRFRPHFYFLGLMFAYLLVRYLRVSVDMLPDFFRFYLTDLLFVPTMSIFALIAVRLLKRDRTLRIPAHYVFIQVVLVSLFFEWYLPNYSSKAHWYTSDLLDVLMYVIGGFLFLLLQRRL